MDPRTEELSRYYYYADNQSLSEHKIRIMGTHRRKNGSYPKGHRFTQLRAIVKNYLGVQRELGIYTQSRECMGLELAERSAGSQ
jgi:hypothetical protein